MMKNFEMFRENKAKEMLAMQEFNHDCKCHCN